MKRLWSSRGALGYAALLAACFAVALAAGWFSIGSHVDNYAYDWMFRLSPAHTGVAHSVVLAIDDATLTDLGGPRNVRTIAAKALEKLAPMQPKLVAIDLILHDPGDPVEDHQLEDALRGVPGLILATDLVDGTWENPLPAFSAHAVALGHSIADEGSTDGVTRQIPLEIAASQKRYLSLSLEAFRFGRRVEESLEDLRVGGTVLPKKKDTEQLRPLRIRYVESAIPRISARDLIAGRTNPALIRGKAVFFGVYSTTAARDRVVTPLGDERMPGVEVNAQAFETLERGDFLVDARDSDVIWFCAAVTLLTGFIFAYFPIWSAYLLAGGLLLAAHAVPFSLFRAGIVFPYFAPLSCAWLSVVGAAAYHHFVIRRQLARSEQERTRYRQAIHFVTHEMRSPLTTIQGSSELMGRYALTEEKQKQLASMIHSESKRLARMIQTFLDVERLTDRQMELKKERFDVSELVQSCLERVRPLADRKRIAIQTKGDLAGVLRGDRELMEYAVYNLLTNAVKYSPPETEISVDSRAEGGQLRLSVQDQGIGIDEKELPRIFQRFYRTKRAEASGENGSGIGLSIVDQIVRHHGGRIDVTSSLGKGSCFTVIVPVGVSENRPSPVST